ncbi:MAG: hypothetical protein PHC62_04025, partial [Candidatus Izemoplasmatales bacterium]|nr:hypothetical protein [Candidatus Izemoplasmatales bacterium]
GGKVLKEETKFINYKKYKKHLKMVSVLFALSLTANVYQYVAAENEFKQYKHDIDEMNKEYKEILYKDSVVNYNTLAAEKNELENQVDILKDETNDLREKYEATLADNVILTQELNKSAK